MTNTITVVPTPGANNPTVINGRTFLASGGAVVLNVGDPAINALALNGWLRLPQSGPTASRPTQGPPGLSYNDTDLDETVWAMVWPAGSGKIVAWTNSSGLQA
jgi:hypothetical protein